jgi:hypothetical protein
MCAPEFENHYTTVLKALLDGRLVPFLGAGVNRCGRPESVTWTPGQHQYLPDGSELSTYLRESFGGPSSYQADLARVSQYISVMNGDGPLYEELHRIFDADYPPTGLHSFLASLPRRLREKGFGRANLLVVTTNYDDVLERAFHDAGEEVDVVAYLCEGEHRGRFIHYAPGAMGEIISIPNEYRDISLDRRSVILKIHGAVDRSNPDTDSYVITEDHYIDYLTRTDLSRLVPATLAAKLRRSNFLFLGYGLRDWNLRVILHRISDEQRKSYRSWAILLHPDELDRRFWNRREVELIDIRLEHYISELQQRIDSLPGNG